MKSMNLIALIVIAFSVLVPVSTVAAGDPELREIVFDIKNSAGRPTPFGLAIIEVQPGFFFVEVFNSFTGTIICENHLNPIGIREAFFTCGIGGGRFVNVFLEVTDKGDFLYSVTLPSGTVLSGPLCPQPT